MCNFPKSYPGVEWVRAQSTGWSGTRSRPSRMVLSVIGKGRVVNAAFIDARSVVFDIVAMVSDSKEKGREFLAWERILCKTVE